MLQITCNHQSDIFFMGPQMLLWTSCNFLAEQIPPTDLKGRWLILPSAQP